MAKQKKHKNHIQIHLHHLRYYMIIKKGHETQIFLYILKLL